MTEVFRKIEKQETEPMEEILVIKSMRHGPKLSAEGEKNDLADYFKDSVVDGWKKMDIPQDKKGLVHINSSDIKRAQNSAEIINELLSETSHRTRANTNFGTDEKLATTFTAAIEDNQEGKNDMQVLLELQTELKERFQKDLPEDMDPQEREAELRNRIDTEVLIRWMNDKEGKLFKIHPDLLADKMAIRYAGFSKHLSRLKELKKKGEQPDDEPYLQIDVSHSYPMMTFLKKYLIFDDGQKAVNMDAEDFFEMTNGVIPESGNFEMSYKISNDGRVEIAVKGKFKDKDFSGTLDTDALEELYNQGKQHINVGE
jgi:hypothetical protein